MSAWLLGKKLSLAALGHARGAPSTSVGGLRAESEALAKSLGWTVLDPFPSKSASSTSDTAAALAYLLRDPGRKISEHLRAAHDARHAALFDMAVRSNVLVLLYAPGDSTGKAAVQGIENMATKAQLSPSIYSALSRKVAAGASSQQVKAAVTEMQGLVEKALQTSE